MALADEAEGDDDLFGSVLDGQRDPFVVGVAQDAGERAATVDGLDGAHLDRLSDVTDVVRRLDQRARNAGGRHLEAVAVEVRPEDVRDGGAELVIDPVRVVDQHAQEPTGCELDVDDLDVGKLRRDGTLDVRGHDCPRVWSGHDRTLLSLPEPALRAIKKAGSSPTSATPPQLSSSYVYRSPQGSRRSVDRPARSGLEEDGHGTVVDQLDLHRGAEPAALDGPYAGRHEGLAEGLVEGLGVGRIGGLGERGPVAFAGVAVQG